MKKADFGAEANQSTPTLGEPMQTSLTGNGDPVLSDPKVKRFLQQLGTKMVSAQFGDAFKPGDRVVHPYLGMGKVIRVHDPAEADEEAGLLYDIRYPEFDIALNQMELMAVPPPPVNPLSVPIKANTRAAIPTAPPHPALQALVSMAPNMAAVAQTQQEEKEAQMEAMAQGADAEGGAEGEEGGDAEGGSDDAPPFGKSEALNKARAKAILPAKKPKANISKPLDFSIMGDAASERYRATAKHGAYRVYATHPYLSDTWGYAVRYARPGDKSGTHLGHEVAATHQAWPEEGPARFHGMHPDQVKHELGRAMEHYEGLGKSADPKSLPSAPLQWSQDPPVQAGASWHFAHPNNGVSYRIITRGGAAHLAAASSHTYAMVKRFHGEPAEALANAKARAEDLHVAYHHSLKPHEIAATRQAWPAEGLKRFHGMHPDQVKHEVSRALAAHPPVERLKSR